LDTEDNDGDATMEDVDAGGKREKDDNTGSSPTKQPPPKKPKKSSAPEVALKSGSLGPGVGSP